MDGLYRPLSPARKYGRVARLVQKLDHRIPMVKNHPISALSSQSKSSNHVGYRTQSTQDRIISSFFANLQHNLTNNDQTRNHQQLTSRKNGAINHDAALYNYMKSHNLFEGNISTQSQPWINSAPKAKSASIRPGPNRRVRFADTCDNRPSQKQLNRINDSRICSERLIRVGRQHLLKEIRMCQGRPSNNYYLKYGWEARLSNLFT